MDHTDLNAPLGKLPEGKLGHDAVDVLVLRSTVAMESMQAQWRRALDLNTHERMALGQLWVAGAVSMSRLGELLSLSRAAVTSLVDGLEELGFLRRCDDPMDRRRTLLRLDAGTPDIFAALAAPFAEELRELAAGLAPREWDTVSGFLRRLEELVVRHGEALRAVGTSELQARTRSVAEGGNA
jgi:DNA-binding MarR family transcriptional regulator